MTERINLMTEEPGFEKAISGSSSPSTILLVDDEKLARMVTRRRLERLGHKIIEAEDGKQAMAILEEHGADLIISDWMMPEMDGPTLCEAVKAHEKLRSTPIILMTALDQPAQIAEGLQRGADDFLTKSASDQEVTARVNAGLRTQRLIDNLERSYEVIAQKQSEMDAELKSAANFVTSLFPKAGEIVPGIRLDWEFIPSLGLGGDLFQVTRWSDEYLGLAILDMSGHGIGPALRAVSLALKFRADHMAQSHPTYDPGEIIASLNKENPLTDEGEYFTIWVGALHLPTRRLRYATAGHPAVVLTRNDQPLQPIGAKTWPIGFGIEEVYQSEEVSLQSGDRLYLFSDGIYEVFSPAEELWDRTGFENACQAVHTTPLKQGLQWIVQQAKDWQHQDTFFDDVALVGLEILS
ncbi:PP2C family protein-serine/threonine phosphatase [Candidatus Nitronereus thalassa]|uniref:SpoIIE family protein phosphatase n=1 Tax=Candidatus Nitronereus thalassa TaxID=3020898 RepID=A0ABU3K658_9BACT|nr:SpoIIE family protein phosphatase [Candidatus Nitronereus thalassa]MDT7041899.1 SpoIIE family protein phosphatase [Candidatus Nitronereus thalassa]